MYHVLHMPACLLWQWRMAAIECGDLEGHVTTDISSPFFESVFRELEQEGLGNSKVPGFLVQRKI